MIVSFLAHAPVSRLIGVAETKRRTVSVTSEPFHKGSSRQAQRRAFLLLFLLLTLRRRDQFYPAREMTALGDKTLAYLWKLFSSLRTYQRVKIGDLMFRLMQKRVLVDNFGCFHGA